jgi:hypothetical protein
MTLLSWSKVGPQSKVVPQPVIGTARGNKMIHNKRTMKKQTIMDHHWWKINCGFWKWKTRFG